MRIGVNLRYLQKNITGIERATLELLKTLDCLPGDHSFLGYVTGRPFVSAQAERELLSCQRLEWRRTRLWREDIFFRLAWDLFSVGWQAARDRVDLFWGPSFSLPFPLPCPGVVTIYDLAFSHFPATFDRVTCLFHRTVTPSSARRADAILTISESSKQDIVRALGVSRERVHVIPLACNQQFRRLSECEPGQSKTLQRYGIRRPFWLTVSQISPRKNLAHLVRVYARLHRERQIPHQLVLVGKNGWLCEEVYATVRREEVQAEVIFTGGVPDADLVALYNAAELFVYPSLYEGFGLPVLEAMACGTPVAVSNSSSLPEVVGEAGVLVSPKDEQELAEALWRLAGDPAWRAELSQRGLAQAAQFSWERSAHRILEVFRQVTASS